MNNPFLAFIEDQNFSTWDDTIPFNKINNDHILPGVDEALGLAKSRLESIRNSTAAPSFVNTVVALETMSDELDVIVGVFSTLLNTRSTDQLQEFSRIIYPSLAQFQNDMILDAKIFSRVKDLYEARDRLGLDEEEMRLLNRYYENFVRNGALLSEQSKTEIRSLDQELSQLGPKFSDNLLKSTNAFQLFIDDQKELAGLPKIALEAAKQAALSKGASGKYLVTLQYPSLLPVLTYCHNRAIREKVWMANNLRASSGSTDNSDTLLKIANLRHRRAVLLGFSSHSAFQLANRMAKTTDVVINFLKQFEGPALAASKKELAELEAYAKATDGLQSLRPWDWAYYSERLKEAKFHFSSEDLRPYFQLEKVMAGVFDHARKLYDLEFRERPDISVYHPEVKAYEVRSIADEKYIGVFYTDLFPRDEKRGGAWMSSLRDQGLFFGHRRRPHITIVANLSRPTPTEPSLLNLDEVRTIFHEFGHALHGLLSECNFRSLSGVNTAWDFVELPSQIMENWVFEREALDGYAKHYQTGTPVPDKLLQSMEDSRKFQAGYGLLRQLMYSILDMAWHSGLEHLPRATNEICAFENRILGPMRLISIPEGISYSNVFSHIFAGGYSAGYYSYKWAEVLDADAFEFFKESGIFSREVSFKFRDLILSQGDKADAGLLYRRFRGRDPSVGALLRREGLSV